MSDSNSFSFFEIPDIDYLPQINLHHKMVNDSRIGHMDTTNNFVGLQNHQNTGNILSKSCDKDLGGGGQLNGFIYGENVLHLQEAVGESLDCYIDTDSSVEDDGISSLFSCVGISSWTFDSPTQANAVGLGESAGHNDPQTSSDSRVQVIQHPRTVEPIGSIKIVVKENANQAKIQECFQQPIGSCISSRNLDSSISPIQEKSSSLNTVRSSCIKATNKKRNIHETNLTSGPNYHLLDTEIISVSDCHDSQLFTENPEKPKKQKTETCPIISFQTSGEGEQDSEGIAQMKDIIYGAAVFRPVNLGLEIMEKPKRKNIKISNDPQTVAARQRRERISERIRVLQTLVPGGSKMDTASMLDEAANYLKFLRSRVKELEAFGQWRPRGFEIYSAAATFAYPSSLPFLPPLMSAQSYFCLQNPNFVNYHRN